MDHESVINYYSQIPNNFTEQEVMSVELNSDVCDGDLLIAGVIIMPIAFTL